MKKDFAAIDAAIIQRIQSGFTRFYEIWPALCEIAGERRPDRIVDRRLQALRKQGRLACVGQSWRVARAADRTTTQK